ncbi:MAG: HPr-rel-A system PqqD family peptide chaperone [Alphaproteobacteria bacterium]|nr:HPr-rel-A system PqqD family peptide chaperone [Alphaproteobacteria bacterium]
MTAGPNKEDWVWVSNPDHYLCRQVGDTSFVYNRLSGTTHIFNLVSKAMLDYLSAGPKSLRTIVTEFHMFLEVPAEECPRGVARRLFDELDDIGLVQRVGP